MQAIYFNAIQFSGVRTEYQLNGQETCVNIRGKLNDFFSSVQNFEDNSCFLLCEHEYCRGRCVQVTNSVANLNLLDFNDMTSSVQRCPPSTTTPSSSTIPSSPSTLSTTDNTSTLSPSPVVEVDQQSSRRQENDTIEVVVAINESDTTQQTPS